uniref:Uncharacterized protein n=1 Tax=Onchocerca volvulus TaxID=6282 RepID=A0A8R1TUT6_ONCVO
MCDQPIETNTTLENQPEILDEPVVTEPLPDVTTLQLAQPSELSEKLVLPSVPSLVLVPTSANWEVSKKTSPVKKFNTISPFFASAEFGNASEEQIDMHNALDKRISSREYILSITDDELSRFPVAFIESFYSDLSLGEIIQLEQRLCDLKTGISSSRRSPEPFSIENENFLKSYRSQITIHTDAGFQNMAEKMGFHAFLQKQQFGLPLSVPTNSCTTSSYVQRPLALNRWPLNVKCHFGLLNTHTHLIMQRKHSSFATPIFNKRLTDGKLSPVIKIADTETENVEIHELNSSNEQTVKSFMDDLLLKL